MHHASDEEKYRHGQDEEEKELCKSKPPRILVFWTHIVPIRNHDMFSYWAKRKIANCLYVPPMARHRQTQ